MMTLPVEPPDPAAPPADRRPADVRALLASRDDPHAFTAVFDAHFAGLHGYLRRRLGDPLAEELAAETLTRAFDVRHRFDPDRAGVRTWLHGIAARLVADHARSEARRLRAYAREAGRSAPGAPEAAAAIARADAAAAGPALARALAGLRAEEREVLLLFAWAELGYDEIATALGIAPGTVRSRLHRARAAVRQALDEEEEDR